MGKLIGVENFNNTEYRTQVYQATHDGKGNRLSHQNKSFISFTYGGKFIEDFNLIVVFDNNRLTKDAYFSFRDITENIDILDGQLYWGSTMEPGQLIFKLATDGMTEEQLDNFKWWFRPGQTRELILSEHPNRYINARVANAPNLSLLPFEKNTKIKINTTEYSVSTTEYKGEITLTFVMDDPFWTAKLNYMPCYINKEKMCASTLEEYNLSSNQQIVEYNDPDMLKIILEDRIPFQESLVPEYFLGGNMIITTMALTDVARIGETRLGVFTEESEGVTLNAEKKKIFYSGTAPCYPKIKFEMTPVWNNDRLTFMNESYIYLKDVNNNLIQTFKFTAPSLITSINKAMDIFSDENTSKIEKRSLINEEVKDYHVRSWANGCLNATRINNNNLKNYMKNFINNNNNIKFIIDSKTGEATATFSCRTLKGSNDSVTGSINEEILIKNVGDMIQSDYLKLDVRNHLSSECGIGDYIAISSNKELKNFLIFYNNKYY